LPFASNSGHFRAPVRKWKAQPSFKPTMTCCLPQWQSRAFASPCQSRQRFGVHLSHDVGAPHLHGDLADTKTSGDLPAQQPGQDNRQDIALAIDAQVGANDRHERRRSAGR